MASLSPGTKLAHRIAREEATKTLHLSVKVDHIIVALCRLCELTLPTTTPEFALEESDALGDILAEAEEITAVFDRTGVDALVFRRLLTNRLGTEGSLPPDGVVHRSQGARDLLHQAEGLSLRRGAPYVRLIHLLTAAWTSDSRQWEGVLKTMHVSEQDLDRALQLPAEEGAQPSLSPTRPVSTSGNDGNALPPLLSRYGKDLSELAANDTSEAVIGRKEEILQLWQVLLRSQRNCAILIGESGVGKTCIVEGLARRLADPDIIARFGRIRIVEIRLSALMAGARNRGELEERWEHLLEESRTHPEIVLFLDEIHTVIGAGGNGGLDAANILKPALARGHLRLIGATTPTEYRRYLEKDEPFQRRFLPLWVEEPTRQQTLDILEGIRPRFEAHHGSPISDAALQSAVELSIRYIPERRLPDKAIELLDEACTGARLKSLKGPQQPVLIDHLDIVTVVSRRYAVPPALFTQDEASRLASMEHLLRQRVKQQEQAIATVCNAVHTARAGLLPDNRPRSVLMFLGPTGTGKTELAKALAEFLFGSEQRLITLNMSEYSQPHMIAKLVGAPQGYIGYEEEGELIASIFRSPYCVLLLDEIEKAHPDVLKLFLRVFDEGHLSDARGRQVSFVETFIILTGNIGAVTERKIGLRAGAPPSAPFRHIPQEAAEAIGKTLSPEFLNRIDQIVFFETLRPESVRQIADKFLSALKQQLEARQIKLKILPSVYELLMEQGYSPEFGAREMARCVRHKIADTLSRRIIEGSIPPGSTVEISAFNGGIHTVRIS